MENEFWSGPQQAGPRSYFFLRNQKSSQPSQPSLISNNNQVTESITQKHLGIFLDTKLDFQERLKGKFSKINKTIAVLRKLHHILPRSPLLSI